MRVLRDNRDSVMAMLEAFVYDPLISWRLLTRRENDTTLDPVPLSRAVGTCMLHIFIHLIVPVPSLFANYRFFFMHRKTIVFRGSQFLDELQSTSIPFKSRTIINDQFLQAME